MYSCNKTWHWVERTNKATVISSWLCQWSQQCYLLRLWLCVLWPLGSLCTSETCLRHQRLLTCTTNVPSWKIFTSIKTLLPLHRSLRSLKLPPQLMFWFSNYQRSVAFAFAVSFTSVTEWCGSQRTKSRGTSFLPCPFFYTALRASVALQVRCHAPARIWLAVIDFQNGEQQKNTTQWVTNDICRIFLTQ